jgi:thioredoxin reductase (NADPH)
MLKPASKPACAQFQKKPGHMPTVAIIGGGPVGVFSVFTCGMLGMKSIVFDRLSILGGQCNLYPDKPIYDIPAYPKIYASDLMERLGEQTAPFHPQIKLNRLISKVTKCDGSFHITDDHGDITEADAIIIAAGIGAFSHKKPPLPRIEDFENKHVFYSVTDKSKFAGKRVLIAGGGDSAADWALELAPIAQRVSVIHRRDNFRCHPVSGTQIQELYQAGKIDLFIPYQLEGLIGDETMTAVQLRNMHDQSIQTVQCDYLLPFFGLSADLTPLKSMGFEFHKNTIAVNPENMMTSEPGIFAIGDIAHYPGKLKLIMNGFGEAATCAHNIRKFLFPDQSFHFEYSTNSGVVGLS